MFVFDCCVNDVFRPKIERTTIINLLLYDFDWLAVLLVQLHRTRKVHQVNLVALLVPAIRAVL